MELPKYTQVGKIIGTHGFKGDVVIAHSLTNAKEFLNWTAIMLSWNPGSHIPFFIEKIKVLNDKELLVKLEEVDSLEEARKYTQSLVFASPFVKVKSVNKNNTDALIGFKVKDKVEGLIGEIIGTISGGGQDLLELAYKDKTLLIPINDAFIVNVNAAKQIIEVNLPEAYLDAFE
jgi:16S rRNA processing protein RimM